MLWVIPDIPQAAGSEMGIVFNPAVGTSQGLSVLSVDAGSAAEEAGIREDDLLLEVDGQSLVNQPHAKAVRAVLGASNPTVVVAPAGTAVPAAQVQPPAADPSTPERPTEPASPSNSPGKAALTEGEWTVSLQKQPGIPLGIKFQSAVEDDGSVAAYVSEVVPGGAAAQNGKVLVGAVVVAVNDQTCYNMAHTAVVDIIKQSADMVSLTLKLGAESEC